MRFNNEKLMIILATQGMTYRDLSRKTGISENAIRSIRNGEAQPRTDTLYKISKALGVSVEELVEWGD